MRASDCRVLLLTGTCGSGKSTLAKLLEQREGWTRASEDHVWEKHFHKSRGVSGSDEHRWKRRVVHDELFATVLAALRAGQKVVIDAIVHEAPPESFEEYRAFFTEHAIPWCLRVLHPRLEVAIERDATRPGWKAGPESVASLWSKFTREVFGSESFIDTSDQTPEESVTHILAGLFDPGARPTIAFRGLQ